MDENESTQEGVLSDSPETRADEVSSEEEQPEEEGGGVVKEGE